MSVATTRPDAIHSLGTGGAQVVGSASHITALSDNLDSSYVTFDPGPDHAYYQFAEPSIPAGAKVIQGRLRVRARKVPSGSSGNVKIDWRIRDPDLAATNIYGFRQNFPVPSTSWTTFTAVVDELRTVHVTPTNILVDIFSYGTGTGPVTISALFFDTVYALKPVVNITAPTGTLTGDTTPTVVWEHTTLDSDGGGQTHFQAKVSTSIDPNAAAIEDSGQTASAALQWEPTTAVSDGTRYFHVRVAQTINGVLHWSDYDTQSFTVSIARPGVPTLSLTAQSANGRIKIDLDDNAGASTTDKFQTQVSNDGTTWVDLRTSQGDGLSTPSGGLATEYDYEASNGVLRHVRTRALHSYAEGYAVSAWTSTQTATWTSSDWWVKNLINPALNVTALPRSQPSTTRTGRVGLFQPLNGKYPVAVLDKRSSASGQIAFRFQTDATRDSFEALCDEASIVLIQAPSTVQDWPDRYVALGDYERERAIDSQTGEYTFDTVSWTEVSRP